VNAEGLFKFQTAKAMYHAIDRQAATIERLQAELAAARPVIDAARRWAASRHTHQPMSAHRHELKNAIETAVADYDDTVRERP